MTVLPRGRWNPDRKPIASNLTDRTDWFSLTAQDESTTDVWIYDEIGWFGVTAADFTAALAEVDTPNIDVHINSPGGDVFDGIAIYTTLRNHDAHVTTRVEGLAASAASFIAQAGDERLIAPNAMVMIHDAWGLTIGPAADHRHMADLLDKVSDDIASIYTSQSGQGSERSWRDLMLTETWYDADETVAAGLADQIDEPAAPADEDVAARMAATFDLSLFAHAGRQAAPDPFRIAAQIPHPPPVKETPAMDINTLVDLLAVASEERRSELIGAHSQLLTEAGITAADVRALADSRAPAQLETVEIHPPVSELVNIAASLPEEDVPAYRDEHTDAIKSGHLTVDQFDQMVAAERTRRTPPPQPVQIDTGRQPQARTRPRVDVMDFVRWAEADIHAQAHQLGMSRGDAQAHTELAQIMAALSESDTTTGVGIVPPFFTDMILDGLPVHTPLTENAVRRTGLPSVGMKIVKPAWTTLPEGDFYTTENTEPATDAVSIGTRELDILSWAHAVKASINLIERGTFGGFTANYYNQVSISYLSDKEARIADDMLAAVVAGPGLTDLSGGSVKARIAELVTAQINQQRDDNGNFRGLTPTFAAVATDEWELLSGTDTDEGVAFGSAEVQIGSLSGRLGSLLVMLVPSLPDGGIIVGASSATELRDGQEMQLRQVIVNTMSVEVGVNANCSIDVEYPTALAANPDAFS